MPESFRFKKSLGQNILTDKNTIAKIILSCGLDKDETVLEIGPGMGALSVPIAREVKELVCVDLDKRMCGVLKDQLEVFSNVKIICADILKFDFSLFKSLKVIGSLPYYITTPIISYLLDNRTHIEEAYLIMQKEVGERLLARPRTKDYGSFSCFVNYFTKPKILFHIKNTCFRPAPKVESVLVKLEILKVPAVKVSDEEFFLKVLRMSFGQRRKTLLNNLKGIITKENFEKFIQEKSFKKEVRAEELSLEEFATLVNYIQAKPH
jgi:16S rRNA (adenine1518-N6/adenine1519-N6)-dimethyltransferase